MSESESRGVGGWLLLFVFCQVLFGPLGAGVGIMQMWDRIGPHPFPVIRQMATIIVIIILLVTVYGIIVGVVIWKGSKRGRTGARQYLMVRLAVAAVIFASLTAWGYNSFGLSGAKRMALAIASPSAVEVVSSLLWLAYFTFSKRVGNTYCDDAEC